MTQCGSISNNHLSLTCKVCRSYRMLPEKVLIERLGWEARLANAVPRLICSHCKAKSQVDFQLVYVGSTGDAMLGTTVSKNPNATGRV
jgi:hypothetical protein